MIIGIVGHEGSKFTSAGEAQARGIIHKLLRPAGTVLTSGHCHLGGIDIWAEEIAEEMGREKRIFPPRNRVWKPRGFEERNIRIAATCDELHCLAVVRLASAYRGMQFSTCYHCNSTDHVKGGGCWTMKRAMTLGKAYRLHRIDNPE